MLGVVSSCSPDRVCRRSWGIERQANFKMCQADLCASHKHSHLHGHGEQVQCLIDSHAGILPGPTRQHVNAYLSEAAHGYLLPRTARAHTVH